MFKITKDVLIITLILFFTSCGGSGGSDSKKAKNSPSKKEAIEMLESVFIGSVSKQDIKDLMGAALTMYKLPLTGENYLKVGNSLTALRKASNKGVSEIDIVTHMILADTGWEGVSFEEQAGISAKSLEAKLANKK